MAILLICPSRPDSRREPTIAIGTFIIRFASGVNGSHPGQLAISYRKENSAIQHILVDFVRLDNNNNNNNDIYGPSFLLDGEC